MTAHNSLLAKRKLNSDGLQIIVSLENHTRHVTDASMKIVRILGPSLQESIYCSDSDIEAWDLAVRLGAWFHDWGKANDHFQKMLRKPGFRQGIRHEFLSLYIVLLLEEWLRPVWEYQPRWFKSGVLFSILGHHLKYPDPIPEDGRPGVEVKLHIGHPDFKKILKYGSDIFSLPSPPEIKTTTLSLLGSGKLKRNTKRFIKSLVYDFNEMELVLISATKTTLMACDLAGSALPDKVVNIGRWIDHQLGQLLKSDQVQKMVQQKLGNSKPKDFQEQVLVSKTRTTLLEAGCGSGKTAAAYLWASKRAHLKRVFFCYPTTGTASEGYIGYFQAPDFESLLIHSRAKVDYRLMPNMPGFGHEENDHVVAGLEALDTWPIPAVVCTAHTVLGLLENVRRGLYAWPSIIRAAFVFDEIHAYSDRLFSYLLRFLEAFPGTPVLLMTATLPAERRMAIEISTKNRNGLTTIQGPKEREEAKRYILKNMSADGAWNEVRECLNRCGKVLYIVNTVKRAMNLIDKAISEGMAIQPYHSRYKYRDRLKRHRAVIDGFITEKQAILAVTTQVAEMSLDLSADLLVSEYAPIPSMIQRLGRLNRFYDSPSECKTGLFIEPENNLPYDDDQLAGLASWIDKIADGAPKSQKDLAIAFVELTTDTGNRIQPASPCDWLDRPQDSGTDRKSIEESGFTIEIIREEDVGASSAAEVSIPMPIPKGFDIQSWRRRGRYFICPAGLVHYDSFKGAQWAY